MFANQSIFLNGYKKSRGYCACKVKSTARFHLKSKLLNQNRIASAVHYRKAVTYNYLPIIVKFSIEISRALYYV